MTTNNHNEEGFDQVHDNDLSDGLFRPALDSLITGVYRSDVSHICIVDTSKGKMLRLLANFQNNDGEELEDSILVTPDWKPGSPFRKLLELSGCLPERRERLDLEGLVGLTFLFTLKVNTKNGRDYVNLVDVALPDDEE